MRSTQLAAVVLVRQQTIARAHPFVGRCLAAIYT